MFSLSFLRFLLFPMEYLRTSRAGTFLSVAPTTISLLILCPASAHAQDGVPLWTNRYDGPANLGDGVSGIAVDSSGNVFVMGHSVNDGFADYATIAYSNAGVPLWTNRYDGPENGEENARAIVVDSSGNVVVTGLSNKNATQPNDPDYLTIKYSNSGVPLWTNRFDGRGNTYDVATAIAVDSSGNVFVTGGSFSGSGIDFVAYYATVAYSSAGELLWSNFFYSGPKNDGNMTIAIAVDSSGNVFVTGDAGPDADRPDYATIAYSSTGVPLWTNRYNGPGNGLDSARAIAVDKSGNVFVTGVSYAANRYAYATIKYTNAGVPLWTNRYNGPGVYSGAKAISVDSSGNVIVTGWSDANGLNDYATVAYSNSGVPLWTNRYDGPANEADYVVAIAVDSNGNVFVTGTSRGVTSSDFATIKYSSSLPPPVHLDFQLLSNQLVLSWPNAGFNLQSAPAITATFTNIPGATSPYTNPLTGPQQFFRLRGN